MLVPRIEHDCRNHKQHSLPWLRGNRQLVPQVQHKKQATPAAAFLAPYQEQEHFQTIQQPKYSEFVHAGGPPTT